MFHMRIITGKSKGRKLKGSRIKGTRPTSQKVKESLFNIIGERICGATFLDLYAGTGAIGIEALSRGAGGVVFVENGFQSRKIIEENLSLTGLGERAEVFGMKAERFVETTNEKFDIVFADPPYRTGEVNIILEKLSRCDIINQEGLLIVEHFKKKYLPGNIGEMKRLKEYRYGDTYLSVYKKGE
ncbi:MAG: 16S rRNA (guanine(966)-N(2))-methyltransferase RsmD [Nitrospirota bacterium]